MIIKYCLFLLLFFQVNLFTFSVDNKVLLTQNSSNQQIRSTVPTLHNDENMYEDDFSPMLFFLLVFALVCIGIGITLTILLLLILFALIGTGILSASILIGLHKKSFTKGFKTFLVSAFTIGGFLVGLIVFWGIHHFNELWTFTISLVSGGLTGAISGFLLGYFIFYVIQKLTTFFKSKLNKLERNHT